MALANCPRCGSLFNKTTLDCCKACHAEEESLLKETQTYLRSNRNAPMFEVMREVEVAQWMLEKWILEKRIQIVKPEEEMSKLRCMYCGREVEPGISICKTCQLRKLSEKPQKDKPAAVPDAEPKAKRSGMHVKVR